MNYPQISFQVRINERLSLEELGLRVEKALQCQFVPSNSNFFDGDKAIEAICLGLWITLSCDLQQTDSEMSNFILMGMLKGDLDAIWEDNYSTISISEYILGLLKKIDKGDWYIADLEELHIEAGLSIGE